MWDADIPSPTNRVAATPHGHGTHCEELTWGGMLVLLRYAQRFPAAKRYAHVPLGQFLSLKALSAIGTLISSFAWVSPVLPVQLKVGGGGR